MELATARKRKSATRKSAKPKSPRCNTCGVRIRIPEGWSAGPAVRRHYWAKHRDVMLGGLGK